MTIEAAELRAKAHEYDLNAERAKELGEMDSANGFTTIALVFRELAKLEARDQDDEEAAA